MAPMTNYLCQGAVVHKAIRAVSDPAWACHPRSRQLLRTPLAP